MQCMWSHHVDTCGVGEILHLVRDEDARLALQHLQDGALEDVAANVSVQRRQRAVKDVDVGILIKRSVQWRCAGAVRRSG